MSEPLRVCVRLELEPQRKAAFEAALNAAEPYVLAEHESPDDKHPWLLITDRAAESFSSAPKKTPSTAAVIAVEVDRSADARLPSDANSREIALAVKLCAQIARLRFANHRQTLAHTEIRQLAETDPLTGLPNRRAWAVNLEQALSQARHTGESLSLGIIDLDHFKRVNDSAGHPHGDKVLQAVAAGLQKATRPGDLLARLGGDEFAVLLGEITPEVAPGVWDRIRTAVADATKNLMSNPVTCSIGYVALVPAASSDPHTLLAAADAALLEAKRSGRNRAVAANL